MSDETPTPVTPPAAVVVAPVPAPKPAKTPEEALLALDLDSIRSSEKVLLAATRAHAAEAEARKQGYPPHAPHVLAAERARADLHLAHAGCAQLMDALQRYVSKKAQVDALHLAAETARGEEQQRLAEAEALDADKAIKMLSQFLAHKQQAAEGGASS
jgi:hypothetical protein